MHGAYVSSFNKVLGEKIAIRTYVCQGYYLNLGEVGSYSVLEMVKDRLLDLIKEQLVEFGGSVDSAG